MERDLQHTYFGAWYDYFTWTSVLLVLNAILGIMMLEWAWSKTSRYRNPIAELNAQFPELSRHDALNWRKWKLYPGAMTVLIPRLLAMLFIATIMVILVNLFLLGHKRKAAMGPIRTFLCRTSVKVCVWLIAFFGWWTVLTYKYASRESVGNYEEYLGSVEE